MSDTSSGERPYSWALAAGLALMLVRLADYGLTIYWLADSSTAHPQDSTSLVWLWSWEAFTGLVLPLLGLMVARGLLTYLRDEQHVSAPRWGWPAYCVCVVIALPGQVLPSLFTVLSHNGPLATWLSDPARLDHANAVLSVLGMGSGIAASGVAALMIGYCVLCLRVLRRGVQPVLAAVVACLGIVAVINSLSLGLSFTMQFVLDRQTAYSPAFLGALNTFNLGFSLFTIILLAALTGLFLTLRRAGAAQVTRPAAAR